MNRLPVPFAGDLFLPRSGTHGIPAMIGLNPSQSRLSIVNVVPQIPELCLYTAWD